jgi:hypothetical protein
MAQKLMTLAAEELGRLADRGLQPGVSNDELCKLRLKLVLRRALRRLPRKAIVQGQCQIVNPKTRQHNAAELWAVLARTGSVPRRMTSVLAQAGSWVDLEDSDDDHDLPLNIFASTGRVMTAPRKPSPSRSRSRTPPRSVGSADWNPSSEAEDVEPRKPPPLRSRSRTPPRSVGAVNLGPSSGSVGVEGERPRSDRPFGSTCPSRKPGLVPLVDRALGAVVVVPLAKAAAPVEVQAKAKARPLVLGFAAIPLRAPVPKAFFMQPRPKVAPKAKAVPQAPPPALPIVVPTKAAPRTLPVLMARAGPTRAPHLRWQ